MTSSHRNHFRFQSKDDSSLNDWYPEGSNSSMDNHRTMCRSCPSMRSSATLSSLATSLSLHVYVVCICNRDIHVDEVVSIVRLRRRTDDVRHRTDVSIERRDTSKFRHCACRVLIERSYVVPIEKRPWKHSSDVWHDWCVSSNGFLWRRNKAFEFQAELAMNQNMTEVVYLEMWEVRREL